MDVRYDFQRERKIDKTKKRNTRQQPRTTTELVCEHSTLPLTRNHDLSAQHKIKSVWSFRGGL